MKPVDDKFLYKIPGSDRCRFLIERKLHVIIDIKFVEHFPLFGICKEHSLIGAKSQIRGRNVKSQDTQLISPSDIFSHPL